MRQVEQFLGLQKDSSIKKQGRSWHHPTIRLAFCLYSMDHSFSCNRIDIDITVGILAVAHRNVH
ncbi:UNVERIFIED_CONTAM: hypothetical protein ABID98_005657 [Brevibacillus sp. OAP136]